MGFMNEFLEYNWGAMTDFLQSVANPENSVHMATYDGYVDLALELATLHLLLCDIFSSLDQVPPPVCPPRAAGKSGHLLPPTRRAAPQVAPTPGPPIGPIAPLSCPDRPRRRSWSPCPPSSPPSGRGPLSPSPSASAPPRSEGTGGWAGHEGPRWTRRDGRSFGRGVTLRWSWPGPGDGPGLGWAQGDSSPERAWSRWSQLGSGGGCGLWWVQQVVVVQVGGGSAPS